VNIAIKHLLNFETLSGPKLGELTAYICSCEGRQLLLIITFS